jgi:hypothetical protein
MSRAASYSVTTGTTTVEYGGSYEYIGVWLSGSNSFQYVEASVEGQPGYFAVVAFNSAGEGPRSARVCAVALGAGGSC